MRTLEKAPFTFRHSPLAFLKNKNLPTLRLKGFVNKTKTELHGLKLL
jgi:hypothetical protein